MKTRTVRAVVIRRNYDDEHTVAIVDAEVDPDMIETPDQLFGAVSEAVTKWAKDAEGWAMRVLGGDINIGDLAGEPLAAELQVELKRWGVLKLEIEDATSASTRWDYDDNLIMGEVDMRVAIVSSKFVAREGGVLTAKHYLGAVDDRLKDVKKAAKALGRAKARLMIAELALESEQRRVKALQESGELKYLE